jgi:hypothetical protein
LDLRIDGTFLTLYGSAATFAPLICSRGDGGVWRANERVDMSHGCANVGLPSLAECKTLFAFVNFAAKGSVNALPQTAPSTPPLHARLPAARLLPGRLDAFGKDAHCSKRMRTHELLLTHPLVKFSAASGLTSKAPPPPPPPKHPPTPTPLKRTSCEQLFDGRLPMVNAAMAKPCGVGRVVFEDNRGKELFHLKEPSVVYSR